MAFSATLLERVIFTTGRSGMLAQRRKQARWRQYTMTHSFYRGTRILANEADDGSERRFWRNNRGLWAGCFIFPGEENCFALSRTVGSVPPIQFLLRHATKANRGHIVSIASRLKGNARMSRISGYTAVGEKTWRAIQVTVKRVQPFETWPFLAFVVG